MLLVRMNYLINKKPVLYIIISLLFLAEAISLSVLYKKIFNPSIFDSLITVIYPFIIVFLIFISSKNKNLIRLFFLIAIIKIVYYISFNTISTNSELKLVLNFFTKSFLICFIGYSFIKNDLFFRFAESILIISPFILLFSFFNYHGDNPDILHFMIAPLFCIFPYFLFKRKKLLFISLLIFFAFITSIDYRTSFIYVFCCFILFSVNYFKANKVFIGNILICTIFLIFGIVIFFDSSVWSPIIQNLIYSYSDITFESNFSNSNQLFLDTRSGIIITLIEYFNNLENFSNLYFGSQINDKIFFDLVERNSTESGFVNILFQYGYYGFVVVYYFFLKSFYNGIYKSKNDLSFYFSIFIFFKIIMSLIQNTFFWVSLDTILTFMIVGLNLSVNFYSKTNSEIKYFIKHV